jgi:hypothetical protein
LREAGFFTCFHNIEGDKMLPFLLKYKDKCISEINGIRIPDKLILSQNIQRHYNECIEEIKHKNKCDNKEE